MLMMSEVVICRPERSGLLLSFSVKRIKPHAVQTVNVLAKSGKEAVEIAHAIFDGAKPVWPEI
jgi:hypothetical protein